MSAITTIKAPAMVIVDPLNSLPSKRPKPSPPSIPIPIPLLSIPIPHSFHSSL